MQVKSIAQCSKGSILQYFRPSLSYQLSLRSLSIFEWPFYTGFTVLLCTWWRSLKTKISRMDCEFIATFIKFPDNCWNAIAFQTSKPANRQEDTVPPSIKGTPCTHSTLNLDNFARVLFSRIKLKDRFAIIQMHDWSMVYLHPARGYKTFFMFNSAEHKIYPPHKC